MSSQKQAAHPSTAAVSSALNLTREPSDRSNHVLTSTKPHQVLNQISDHQQIDICDNNNAKFAPTFRQLLDSAPTNLVASRSANNHRAIISLPQAQQESSLHSTSENSSYISESNGREATTLGRSIKFKSLLSSPLSSSSLPATVIEEGDETIATSNGNNKSIVIDNSARHHRQGLIGSGKSNSSIVGGSASSSELIDLTQFNSSQTTYCDTNVSANIEPRRNKTELERIRREKQFPSRAGNNRQSNNPELNSNLERNIVDNHNEPQEHDNLFGRNNHGNLDTSGSDQDYYDDDNYDQDDDDDDDDNDDEANENDQLGINDHYEPGSNNLSKSPSHHKLKARNTILNRLYRRFKHFGSDLSSRVIGSTGESTISYTPYQDTSDQLNSTKQVGSSVRKYRRFGKQHRNSEQNFRGSYRYSRIGITMTIIKKFFSFLVQRSTLALFGAFLIHVTLGTIYTLSNINSYLTSYMRKHGSPNATYGGSMWISSSYAVGQGISMVLGGLIERRFSARVSCIIGCALHSLSIMSTSYSVNYGQLAVLLTYGFLPGFGCGLAYMTPMSNGFGWFPHRKGLVAGVILAGFGIGTFVFNMAQTAYVNPQNLSPPKESGGYFTQDTILDNVPHLFTFLGTIYATMQFVGCCLLFKPPSAGSGEQSGRNSIMSDEQPILIEAEMSFKKAIRTREFVVLFMVFGITNQGVLFVNAMLKEYGQLFIDDDLYLAWTGSMASIANSLGRLVWGMAIDRFTFTQCFTSITTIFGTLIFLMPFEFILSSKLLYLLCTLGIFGSFSGWMSTYPVHLSRIFGLSNSGMIYGLIFVSQSLGGIVTAFAAHYLIDQYSRFVPFFFVTFLEVLGLAIFHLFYENK